MGLRPGRAAAQLRLRMPDIASRSGAAVQRIASMRWRCMTREARNSISSLRQPE